jgi:hypothetical protein
MKSFSTILALACAIPHIYANKCLSEHDVSKIANNWLSIWSTPPTVRTIGALNKIVTKDIISIDETFGPATNDSQQLFAQFQLQGPYDVISTQTPQFWLYNCDQIAVHWIFKGKTTGNHK